MQSHLTCLSWFTVFLKHSAEKWYFEVIFVVEIKSDVFYKYIFNVFCSEAMNCKNIVSTEYVKFARLAGHVQWILKNVQRRGVDLTGHFVRRRSIKDKVRHFTVKILMSGENSKCPAKDWRFTGQNVQRGSNQFHALWVSSAKGVGSPAKHPMEGLSFPASKAKISLHQVYRPPVLPCINRFGRSFILSRTEISLIIA